MRRLLTLLSIFLISVAAKAQAPEYNDLKILYADENYPKLVKEAEKYTTKDDTAKDPIPYIWMAKGLYKISLSGTTDDDFKSAYKDAIKYLAKAFKYDLKYNEGVNLAEEKEFIDMFQMSLMETIVNELSSDNMKKAFSWAIKYWKITEHEVGTKFMLGATKFDEDKTGAKDYWKDGKALLDETTSIDGWSEADVQMLKLGILYSAKAMKSGRQEEYAKEILDKATPWFEGDEEWQQLYDEFNF